MSDQQYSSFSPNDGQFPPPTNSTSGGYNAAPPPAYQGYVMGPVLADHPNSTPSLVLGIISILLCGLTAPFGLYMAIKGRREVAANPGTYREGGTLTAGLVLNIIGLVQLVGWVLYVVVVVVMVLFSGLMAFTL
jgi:hypothetical protein